jgi:hypothetical protein
MLTVNMIWSYAMHLGPGCFWPSNSKKKKTLLCAQLRYGISVRPGLVRPGLPTFPSTSDVVSDSEADKVEVVAEARCRVDSTRWQINGGSGDGRRC